MRNPPVRSSKDAFFMFVASSLALMAICLRIAYAEPGVGPQLGPRVAEEDSALIQTLGSAGGVWPGEVMGDVMDAEGKPISHASIVFNGKEYFSNEQGHFRIPQARSSSSPLIIKKAGYRRVQVMPTTGTLRVTLRIATVKAVFVSTASLKLGYFVRALNLMGATELNGMVVDVKDDDGIIRKNLKEGVAYLHSQNIYAIARVVTFKDNKYPRKNPEVALRVAGSGTPWMDKKRITYLNPFDVRAWEYNVSVAKMAIEAGFDEIQFDYVRFPTDGNIKAIAWSKPYNEANRVAAIAGFLKYAREKLGGTSAYIAADVFGITAFEKGDFSKTGQKIEEITAHIDYVCPMVYPSGYAMNTAGLGNPVDHPKEIVQESMRRYRLRADPSAVLRPWLQAFRDYAYNHRNYGQSEISAQILGASFGSPDPRDQGFMLWNAAGNYTGAGIKKSRSYGKLSGGVLP